MKYAGTACFGRFLVHCKAYVEAVATEAALRERDEVYDLASFEPLRRENSAIRLCFGLFEFALGVDLPDAVFEDPAFMNLYWAAADMVCWSNVSDNRRLLLVRFRSDSGNILKDVYSYSMEYSRGIAGNNVVTVLMQERQVDLQTAANLVGEHCKELMFRFIEGKKSLPSQEPDVQAAVNAYIDAMGHWIVGNLIWSFETTRYFGPNFARVKETRVVNMMPRRPE